MPHDLRDVEAERLRVEWENEKGVGYDSFRGDEDVAVVDLDRCIGCGLCVTTCTTEAMSLQPKPDAERREPPENAQTTLMELAQKRGKSLEPLSVMKAAGNA